MTDVLAQWRLHDFDDLRLFSFALNLPPADWPNGFTISFWFWAADTARKQVILQETVSGWNLFIENQHLVFDGRQEQTAALIHSTTLLPGWHHTALSTDPNGIVRLSVDGAHQQFASSTPTGQLHSLMVGGYTDPAGGHFDHTFGRRGSGLIDDFRVYGDALDEMEFPRGAGNAAPPRAQVEVRPPQGNAPMDVLMDASGSNGTEYPILHYLWDFGDGTSGSGAQIQHRYEYAGQYTVQVTVIDAAYGQSSAAAQIEMDGRPNPLNFVPVFVNGTEGYACYRIPSIVRALNDDLLAFAEARLESCSDSTGTIHIVGKRSTDHGRTWSALQVVATVEGFVAMNAAPVVDHVHGTGRVVLVFRAASHSEWDIARGVGISRAMCVISDDHGLTWQPPRDISASVHKPYNPDYAGVCPAAGLLENQSEDWRIQIPSQGHAIQLQRHPATRGRLFFAGSLTRGDRPIFASENYAFWSDDLGETWTIGGIIPCLGLNEAIAAELEDGSVLFNTRAYTTGKPDGCRAITRAAFGENGTIHYDSTTHDALLIDPAVQASLLRCTWSDETAYGGKSRLIFSNPAHPRARVNLTVRLSYDEGQTWPNSKVVDRGPSAYSDLVLLPDRSVGVLYERGNTGGLTFVRITLDWLTDGGDTL